MVSYLWPRSSPSPAWSASSYSLWVMYPCFAIAWSTSLRRSTAPFGFRNGLYSEGACGSPAISAASGRSSLETGFEK